MRASLLAGSWLLRVASFVAFWLCRCCWLVACLFVVIVVLLYLFSLFLLFCLLQHFTQKCLHLYQLHLYTYMHADTSLQGTFQG